MYDSMAKYLVSQPDLIQNMMDEDGSIPLHLACKAQNLEIVKELVIHGNNKPNHLNQLKMTPFDIACERGNIQIVAFLLENGATAGFETETKQAPILHAAMNGHANICKLLLKNGADPTVTVPNVHGSGPTYNALEISIEKNIPSCAKVFLDDSNWLQVMRKRTRVNKNYESPMRKLIRNMPELAEQVMDKCITVEIDTEDTTIKKFKYNYELLDDSFTVWLGDERNGDGTKSQIRSLFARTYSRLNTIQQQTVAVKKKQDTAVALSDVPYVKDKTILRENHPLNVMAMMQNEQLLNHKLTQSLLDFKWNRFGAYVYVWTLINYLLFLLLLTIY
ncbi:hypothetical protein Ciccas_014501, partial [Cichlidogyrus casuarinus]